MPQAIQRRRGTTAAHAVFTGLAGELTVDTDKKTLVVHDGVTVGGTPLATAASVAANTTAITTKADASSVAASLALKADASSVSNVNNTSDANKPVSTAQASALALKVSMTAPTGSMTVPSGTTAQRPGTPGFGETRANATTVAQEWWNGTAWAAMGVGAAIGSGHGQCQMSLVAGSLKLLPKNGNMIMVNGVQCVVPDAGVVLAPTALLSTTLYYIYAVATAGSISSLEASVTGHSTDATAGNKGVEVKTGDSTRTFVGMAYVKTAATFADTGAQRFVRSWFNEPSIAGANQLAVNTVFGSPPYTEINNAIRAEFVSFAGEKLRVTGGYTGFDAAAGTGYMYGGFGLDGGGQVGRSGSSYQGTSGTDQSAGFAGVLAPAEGYHYLQILGGVSGGASPTYRSSSTGLEYTCTR